LEANHLPAQQSESDNLKETEGNEIDKNPAPVEKTTYYVPRPADIGVTESQTARLKAAMNETVS
jgi:hypothetical protein